jgi:effector-binding domain-containing protein
MNLKRYFSFLFILLSFVACNDYEKIMGPALKVKMGDKNPNPVFDGEVEPAMPDPSENDKTLLGIDSNKNGIRDDIDIWINRTGKTYNERMALRQLAKAYRDEWIAGNMAYENFQKGPIDVFNPKERDYNRMISGLVQKSASADADATMGCMHFIFVEPVYAYKDLQELEYSLEKLYSNTSLRKEASKAYYTYNHYYAVSENKKNDYEFCLFNVENLEKSKTDYESSYKIKREKSRNKNDKK